MTLPNTPLSRRLGFRLLAPLVLLVLVTGTGFALVLLGLVRDFQHKLVEDDLTWTSRVVYKIIDDHYYTLLRAGTTDDPVQQRIQQGRAMDDLESFMRQKEFQAVLLGPDQGGAGRPGAGRTAHPPGPEPSRPGGPATRL